MKNYVCKLCVGVHQVFKINLPVDLKIAIRVIHDNIADGTVIESDFWPNQQIKLKRQPSLFQMNKLNARNVNYYFDLAQKLITLAEVRGYK